MFTLPELPYAYPALEPHIDARTMEIHHSKHHNAYITNLNKALEGHAMANASLEELMSNMSTLTAAIRNNGGGHYNHSLFWSIMSPNGGGNPLDEIGVAIKREFASFEKFKEAFANAGVTRFGSGWAWLYVKSDKSLAICSTPNQDNPLMDIAEYNGIPILGMDVWEHAYYLHYQNRRPDYISAFWNVVNWKEVNRRYLDTQ